MARITCFIVLLFLIFQNTLAIENKRYGAAPEVLHVNNEKDAELFSPKIIAAEALVAFVHNGRSRRSLNELNQTKSVSPADVSKDKEQIQQSQNNITTMVSKKFIMHAKFELTIKIVGFELNYYCLIYP